MIRKDFVSNSSSCSFIIHLKSQKDVDEFKKIFDAVISKAHITSYLSCDKGYFTGSYSKPIYDKESIDKNTFLYIYVGEDNEGDFIIDRFREVEDIVKNQTFKFKIYSDPDAHVTCGIKYTKSS